MAAELWCPGYEEFFSSVVQHGELFGKREEITEGMKCVSVMQVEH